MPIAFSAQSVKAEPENQSKCNKPHFLKPSISLCSATHTSPSLVFLNTSNYTFTNFSLRLVRLVFPHQDM